MKSIFLSFILLIVCFVSNAQEPTAAVELTEMNILYRGYENKILIAVENCENALLRMSGANCAISQTDNDNEYILKPGSGKNAILSIYKELGDSTELIREITYRVYNLPDPTLYWGGAKSGNKGALTSRLIFAKYPASSPLNNSFEIKKWAILVGSNSVRGEGNRLDAADSLFRSISNETTVIISVTVEFPDGRLRNLSGSWSVGKFLKKEEE